MNKPAPATPSKYLLGTPCVPGPRRASWSQAAAGTARDDLVHSAPPFLGLAWCFLSLSRCFGFHVTVKNSELSGAEGEDEWTETG